MCVCVCVCESERVSVCLCLLKFSWRSSEEHVSVCSGGFGVF